MRTAGLLALLLAASNSLGQFQTYQGRLDESGTPANGTYDFRVEYFTDAAGTTPIGTPFVFDNWSVANGLFTLEYSALPTVFTGGERWMKISVRPGASTGSFSQVSLNRVNATPYAVRSLNERWSPINPTQLATDAGISSVFINTSVAPFPDAALTTRGSSTTFSGIYSDVASGTGVSYFGWAVGGLSKLEARYSGALNRFTMGTETATFLYMESDGRIGIGGVPASTALLQVNGDVRVAATATAAGFSYAAPATRTISLPPGAFQSANSSSPTIGNDRIFFSGAAATTGSLVAPINLPEGATVTAVRAHVVDNTAGTITVDLWRNTFTGSTLLLASASSVGASAGTRAVSDTTITSPVIANTTGAYAVWVSCDGWDTNNCMLRAVQVDYTVPSPD